MSAITLTKLQRVLYAIDWPAGLLRVNEAGELEISFNGQLDHVAHAHLLKQGFVYDERCYIYRPRAPRCKPKPQRRELRQ